VALALAAVICGLLPSGTDVRAGSIMGWLAAIGVFLISKSIIAIDLGLTGWNGAWPAPAYWAGWVALGLGIALLADGRRRPLSAR
jgi:hypothetical protein